MDEELAVARGSGDRGFGGRKVRQSYCRSRCDDFFNDTLLHGGILDHTTLANFASGGFKLRLHQGDHVGCRCEQRGHGRQDVAEGDERDVDDDQIDRRRQVMARQRASIDTFDDDNAGVGAKVPGDLAASDIQRHYACRAAPQEHVGKAPGRSANIERLPSVHCDAEGLERVGELDPTAANIRMIRLCERNRRVGWDALTCLLRDRAVDLDLPGQNQRAGPLSRAGQGSFDEKGVESDTGH